MKFKYLFLLMAFSLMGCQDSHKTDDPVASIKIDTEQVLLIDDFQPDRVIWQKPELIVDLLGDISTLKVADIGAGVGFFTFRLLPKSKKVIASDIDGESLGVMRELSKKLPADLAGKLSIVEALPDDPQLAEDKVDVIFLSNTYMYLKDRVKYLINLRKYLSPKSKILIVDFKKKNMDFGPPVGEKIDLSQVEDELAQADYKIIKSDDTSLDYQYIVLAQLEIEVGK